MHTVIARNWWTLAARGVLALIFGLAALFWPEATLGAVAVLFGLYALADGILAFASGLLRPVGAVRPWWSLVAEGFIGIGLGIAAFAWPEITLRILIDVIAAWAVIGGVFSLAAAGRMRQDVRGEWLLAASGILSVLLGLTLMIAPGVGLLAVLSLVGVYALAFGTALIALGVRLRFAARSAVRDARLAAFEAARVGQMADARARAELAAEHELWGQNPGGDAARLRARLALEVADELPGARRAPAWGAVVAGAVVAIAAFFVIDTLGAALGLSITERITGENLAASSVAWLTLSVVVSLFSGGWFMARLIGLESAGQASMHGTLLWGVVFAGLLVFATTGIVTGLSTFMGVPEPSVEAMSDMELDDNGLPTSLSTVLANPLTKSAAWWAFGGMMLSMVATIGGAAAGRRAVVQHAHPDAPKKERLVAWGTRAPAGT